MADLDVQGRAVGRVSRERIPKPFASDDDALDTIVTLLLPYTVQRHGCDHRTRIDNGARALAGLLDRAFGTGYGLTDRCGSSPRMNVDCSTSERYKGKQRALGHDTDIGQS
jgi:hypothetical protein